jgi:hypothetical protein
MTETTVNIKDANGNTLQMLALLDNGVYTLVNNSRTYRQQKVEEGKFFAAEYTVALENGQGFNLLLTTGALPSPIFDFLVSVLADTTFQLYEDTDSSGGSAVEIVNLNRVVGGLPQNSTFTLNPTIVTDGTLIVDRSIGAGKDYISTQETSGAIFLLKPNSKYLFKLLSTANGNKVQFNLNIIE